MVPLTTYDDYAPMLLSRQAKSLPAEPVLWIQTTWEGGVHPLKVAPYTKGMLDTYKRNVIAVLMMCTAKHKGDFDISVTDHMLYALAPLPYATGLLPLLFFRCRKTVYDLVSGALVCLFSLLLLVGLPAVIVMPLSYFAFGMMWSISVFLKIPLSAEYSMNDYGGEPALKNPMFIRTNRILTAAWGVLYLLTPIWTWFIMRSAASGYVGLINSVLPALLGLFTLWFQKWYPRRMARP